MIFPHGPLKLRRQSAYCILPHIVKNKGGEKMTGVGKFCLVLILVLLCNGTNASAGLVGYWNFEEGIGTVAHDSANNSDGNIYGASWTSGKVGNALNFDGINDYIDVGDIPILDISSAITLEAWAKTTLTTNDTIISKDDDHGNREYYLGLGYGVEVPGKVRWALKTTAFEDIDSSESANDGQWHHIAATYDGSYLRTYIDGIEDSNSPIVQTGFIPNTNASFRIGAMSDIGYEQYFQGTIDEVRIYNNALTQDEIVRDMNFNNTAVPEPSTIFLLGSGLLGTFLRRRRIRP